jgi:hypothetical protein
MVEREERCYLEDEDIGFMSEVKIDRLVCQIESDEASPSDVVAVAIEFIGNPTGRGIGKAGRRDGQSA